MGECTRTRVARASGCAAALSMLVLASAPAVAENDRKGSDEELARVSKALEAKGYSEVRDLEVDDGRFEVDARNPQNEPVDLELDMKTLEVLHEDRD
jgi:Peptidase propeptide and YPEB domain